jgi:hypothetical protein
MPLDYFLADGEAHSGSYVLAPAMQPLEWGGHTIETLLLQTR